jgi:ABC-type molybdate transport system substrate-binding protein
VLAAAEVPALDVVAIPEELSVGADYGLVVLNAGQEAQAFAEFILSEDGQAVLASYGFGSPRETADP